MPEENKQNQSQPEEKKRGFGFRLLVASAGSYIGAKLGVIGTAIDVRDLLKGKNMSFGEKAKYILSGSAFSEAAVNYLHSTNDYSLKNQVMAAFKPLKYSSMFATIGIVVGGVIGWTRSGRIENWKDVFKHPWQSTKVIFGFAEPDTIGKSDKTEAKTEAVSTKEQGNSNRWQNYVEDKKQKSAVVANYL